MSNDGQFLPVPCRSISREDFYQNLYLDAVTTYRLNLEKVKIRNFNFKMTFFAASFVLLFE